MFTMWISMDDIPAEGRVFSFADADKWEEAFEEFGLACALAEDRVLAAEVFVLPQEEGCLIRGEIKGQLTAPCDRCAEEAAFTLNCSFEEFEPFPGEGKGEGQEDEDEERIDMPLFRRESGQRELNLATVAWEQFSLALPGRQLCASECKGLCSQCGADLNKGACGCEQDQGDLRMAPLRNLKLNK